MEINAYQSKITSERKDGGEIGGSRVHFPLHMGETLS